MSKYDKAMARLKVPAVPADIEALHDSVMVQLMTGLPDRLRHAIKNAIAPRLADMMKESSAQMSNTLNLLLSEYNASCVARFQAFLKGPPGVSAVTPYSELHLMLSEMLHGFPTHVRSGLGNLEKLNGTELDDKHVPGYGQARSALRDTLEALRGRAYAKFAVRAAKALLHSCSEQAHGAPLEVLLTTNVSSTHFVEPFEAFVERCGAAAQAAVNATIMNRAFELPDEAEREALAEASGKVDILLQRAHLRRRALLEFMRCVASAGLPIEPENLQACQMASVRLCRDEVGIALCTITEEIELLSANVSGINTNVSFGVCTREGEAIVSRHKLRAETWWTLDSASSWYSPAVSAVLLAREWSVGSCRGPAKESEARTLLIAESKKLVEQISNQRQRLVDDLLWGVYGVAVLGLCINVSFLCAQSKVSDHRAEAQRRSQQMWEAGLVALLLLLAAVVAVALAVVAPHAVWRVQLSRQAPKLNMAIDEPDGDSVPLGHVALCNILLVRTGWGGASGEDVSVCVCGSVRNVRRCLTWTFLVPCPCLPVLGDAGDVVFNVLQRASPACEGQQRPV